MTTQQNTLKRDSSHRKSQKIAIWGVMTGVVGDSKDNITVFQTKGRHPVKLQTCHYGFPRVIIRMADIQLNYKQPIIISTHVIRRAEIPHTSHYDFPNVAVPSADIPLNCKHHILNLLCCISLQVQELQNASNFHFVQDTATWPSFSNNLCVTCQPVHDMILLKMLTKRFLYNDIHNSRLC